jgi:hypothetical protein
MKKFHVRISDRLFSEDSGRSKEISVQLKKLEKELPAIMSKMEEVRDGKYWLAYEAQRKAIILSYSGEKLKELQANLWALESEMKGPLEAHKSLWHELNSEIENLTRPLRAEIVGIIEKYLLQEVSALRSSRTLGTEKRFVDKGERGEGDVLIRTVQDNFRNVEKIVNLLINFKFKIRNEMNRLCCGEIVEAVRKFESEINSIDINATEKKEISEAEWKDLRASGLI